MKSCGRSQCAHNTLADAVARIQNGSVRDAVLAEFVDAFDLAKTDQARYASIEHEPKLTGDNRLDALVGAIAEYLAKQRRPRPRSPLGLRWRRVVLDSPWFTTESPSDSMREYLTFSSPAEFASRNIFTEERPLRRAARRSGVFMIIAIDGPARLRQGHARPSGLPGITAIATSIPA